MKQNPILKLLPRVSRTFALSIKMLRRPLKNWVAEAYLLCRILDSFEDDTALPLREKAQTLSRVQQSLKERSIPDIEAMHSRLTAPEAEVTLVARSGELFRRLYTNPEYIIQSISVWASEMAEGMKEFAITSDNTKNRIQEMEDLDRYCYYVAGTVGNMLTEMFCHACGGITRERNTELHNTGESFGKALQLVNIIKDSPADFKEKRCYIPHKLFQRHNISKIDFFGGRDLRAARSVYNILIARAEQYLGEARRYIEALPRHCYFIRLFCILPVLLARQTLDLIKGNIPALLKNPGKLKISRKAVRRSVYRSYLAAASNSYLRHLLD